MAKKISNKDFIEEGFGKPLLDFFKQLDAQITESTKKVQGLATELKKEISANKLTSGADVQKLSKQKEQAETIKKLFKEQEQARKELAKIAEREAKEKRKLKLQGVKKFKKQLNLKSAKKLNLLMN